MDKLIEKIVKKYKTNCPFQIAEALNIIIVLEDLGKITNGFFHRRLRRNYIVLHYDQPYWQQRFTCAHELGHYFHDRGSSYFMIERNTLSLPGKYERRADRFATRLLIHGDPISPGESIYEYCRRNGIPEEMHQYF